MDSSGKPAWALLLMCSQICCHWLVKLKLRSFGHHCGCIAGSISAEHCSLCCTDKTCDGREVSQAWSLADSFGYAAVRCPLRKPQDWCTTQQVQAARILHPWKRHGCLHLAHEVLAAICQLVSCCNSIVAIRQSVSCCNITSSAGIRSQPCFCVAVCPHVLLCGQCMYCSATQHPC